MYAFVFPNAIFISGREQLLVCSRVVEELGRQSMRWNWKFLMWCEKVRLGLDTALFENVLCCKCRKMLHLGWVFIMNWRKNVWNMLQIRVKMRKYIWRFIRFLSKLILILNLAPSPYSSLLDSCIYASRKLEARWKKWGRCRLRYDFELIWIG